MTFLARRLAAAVMFTLYLSHLLVAAASIIAMCKASYTGVAAQPCTALLYWDILAIGPETRPQDRVHGQPRPSAWPLACRTFPAEQVDHHLGVKPDVFRNHTLRDISSLSLASLDSLSLSFFIYIYIQTEYHYQR